MSLITKNIILNLQRNNPIQYLKFKERIKELKALKDSQNQLNKRIQNIIKSRIESNEVKTSNTKSEIIELGESLDDLIKQEDDLRMLIGMDKVNLNIPLSKFEQEKVAEVLKTLLGDKDHYEPVGGGYAALFKNEKK
jgi:hypothetical protein